MMLNTEDTTYFTRIPTKRTSYESLRFTFLQP